MLISPTSRKLGEETKLPTSSMAVRSATGLRIRLSTVVSTSATAGAGTLRLSFLNFIG